MSAPGSMGGGPTDRDRVVELMCDRALEGLSPDGDAELEGLLASCRDLQPFGLRLELAAAATELAALTPREPIPQHLAARVWGQAGQVFQPTPAAPAPAPVVQAAPVASATVVPLRPAASPRDRVRWLGWLAAAACFLLALAAWLPSLLQKPVAKAPDPVPTVPASVPAPPEPQKVASAAELRARLLEDQKDIVKVAWSAAKDPLGKGVSGDVVWSATAQSGFMRLEGLAPNDPLREQYQLWIFDKNQDQATPVDGGVFDVSASGEVVVPISAKLHVAQPTLFAVTVEKPGGVVVSKRERLVITAAVTG